MRSSDVLKFGKWTRSAAATALVAFCALSSAQDSVYKSKDKAGPVFSDEPSPGAKVIDLPPPNVIQSDPVPTAPAPSIDNAPPPYRSLTIQSPADGSTIHTNTGEFSVSVNISPALRAGAGDRIRVTLDGNALPSSHQSAKFKVTAGDWQGAAEDRVEHTLQVALVDKTGAVLLESAPASFYAHRATR